MKGIGGNRGCPFPAILCCVAHSVGKIGTTKLFNNEEKRTHKLPHEIISRIC